MRKNDNFLLAPYFYMIFFFPWLKELQSTYLFILKKKQTFFLNI